MRAMILAAGRGERMRPLTDTTPKPLLKAGGKPLIVWHIERLVAAGIPDIVINHAWLGQQIEQALGDGRHYGAHLSYSAEPLPLETAGGIAQALDFFHNAPFLVINGDVWCDWNPVVAQRIAARLHNDQALAWLLLVDNPAHHPHGDFYLQKSGQVCNYADVQGGDAHTFSGVGVYSPKLFNGLVRGHVAPLAPLLREAIDKRQVYGSHYSGQWADIGTPERLAQLDLTLA